MSIIDGHRDLQSESAPSQPLQREPSFGDSSGKLFSIYSNVAEDEDKKMVERWQKDADAILIFVSPCVSTHDLLCITGTLYCRPVYSLPPSLHSLL